MRVQFGLPVISVLSAALLACARSDGPALQGAERRASGANAGQWSGDSLLAAAQALYGDEQYDSARTLWTIALDSARNARDERTAARVLTRLSNAWWRLGNLARARRHGEEAVALKTRLGMREELAVSYAALGLIAYSEGRNEDAVHMHRSAAEAARAVGDSQSYAKAAGNMALPALDLGDASTSREGSRILREVGRTLDSARFEGNGLANEAMVDIWIGDPAPAIARLDTARQIYRRIRYTTGEENALRQLATAYDLTGEYDRALAALDSAVAIARQRGLREQEAEDLRLIAGVHTALGDHRRALRYFERAERLARQVGLDNDVGNILRGAAVAQLRLRNLRRAAANAHEALRLHTAASEPLEQLDDLLLLAEIAERAKRPASADSNLRVAGALARQIDTRGARIAVAVAEAKVADVRHESRRVLRALREVGEDVARGDLGAAWESSALSARAYMRLGTLDSAVISGRRAIDAVERLRGSLASHSLRSTFVADRADVYCDLVVALLRLGRGEEAFGIADAARSRDLVEHLSAARSDAASGHLPPELIEAEDLLRQIDVLARRLRDTPRRPPTERGATPDTLASAIAERLARARSDYEALLIRAAQRNPRATALLSAREVRLDDVRAALEPGEVLVEYLLASDRLVVFVVDRGGMRVFQSSVSTDALSQRVRLLQDLWGSSRSDWRRGLPVSQALDSILVEPLVREGMLNGARRLLVVPHGVLAQLPFAALQRKSSGRFLAEHFAVIHLPSAASLPHLRRESPTGAERLPAAEGFAPLPNLLPASRSEVAALEASLPRARIATGADASELAVRRALATDAIVHVATHGVLNVRSPMFSRVELARPAGVSSSQNDGRLEVHEIIGLDVRSPLVFFSGCETGARQGWTDEPIRGTGDLTLTQALLAAGASNVVSTLWRIDDEGAAVFARHFYASLRQTSAADAFATAQRTMARGARYASPYYWAGYTLSGDGRIGRRAPQAGASASVP
jgi:CHAT domain-containing protein